MCGEVGAGVATGFGGVFNPVRRAGEQDRRGLAVGNGAGGVIVNEHQRIEFNPITHRNHGLDLAVVAVGWVEIEIFGDVGDGFDHGAEIIKSSEVFKISEDYAFK